MKVPWCKSKLYTCAKWWLCLYFVHVNICWFFKNLNVNWTKTLLMGAKSMLCYFAHASICTVNQIILVHILGRFTTKFGTSLFDNHQKHMGPSIHETNSVPKSHATVPLFYFHIAHEFNSHCPFRVPRYWYCLKSVWCHMVHPFHSSISATFSIKSIILSVSFSYAACYCNLIHICP